MKHAPEYAKRLSTLLKKLRQAVAISPPVKREPLIQLIHSFLCYGSTHRRADEAYNKIMSQVIDLNDLRVTDPREIVAMAGCEDDDHAYERCHRLKSALQGIYAREHAVDLNGLLNKNKKDARQYLETLDGMPQFVAASVMLLCLDGHAIPIDPPLLERLKKDHVVDSEATVAEAASFIEHHIKHDEAVDVYQLLRAYVEKPVKVDLGPVPKVLLEKPKPAPPPPPAPKAPEKPAAKATAPAPALSGKSSPKPPAKPVAKPSAKPAPVKQTKKPTKLVAAKTAKKATAKAPAVSRQSKKTTKKPAAKSGKKGGRR